MFQIPNLSQIYPKDAILIHGWVENIPMLKKTENYTRIDVLKFRKCVSFGLYFRMFRVTRQIYPNNSTYLCYDSCLKFGII